MSFSLCKITGKTWPWNAQSYDNAASPTKVFPVQNPEQEPSVFRYVCVAPHICMRHHENMPPEECPPCLKLLRDLGLVDYTADSYVDLGPFKKGV